MDSSEHISSDRPNFSFSTPISECLPNEHISSDRPNFTFSTPISECLLDWKLTLSLTESDSSTGQIPDVEISPIPTECQRKDEAQWKPGTEYSDGKDTNVNQLTSRNESQVILQMPLFSTKKDCQNVDNLCSHNSTSSNYNKEIGSQSPYGIDINKNDSYDAKPDLNKDDFMHNTESNSYFSNYVTARDMKTLVYDEISYIPDETSSIYEAASDSINSNSKNAKNIRNFSGVDIDSRVTHCSDSCSQSLFRSFESSILSEDFLESIEKDLEIGDDICEDLPDNLISDLPDNLISDLHWTADEAFSLTSNVCNTISSKNNTKRNANSLETIHETDEKELFKNMEVLEVGGSEMMENPLNVICENSMNLNVITGNRTENDYEASNDVVKYPYTILSPIPEMSCENSSCLFGDTNDTEMVSANDNSEGEEGEAEDFLISTVDDNLCKVPKVLTASIKRDYNGLEIGNDSFKIRDDEMKQEVKEIMDSLVAESQTYYNNNISRVSAKKLKTKRTHVSPIIIKLHSPSAAKFDTPEEISRTAKDSKVEESKISTAEVIGDDFESMSSSNSDSNAKHKNENSTDNKDLNTNNECSVMEISVSEPSCSYMSDSSFRIRESNPFKELNDVNKTVANAVLKSMLKLGNNKISIPQILRYITEHKVMGVHSKTEQDVRKFLKTACETGVIKSTNHRYTLFSHKNITPAKESVSQPQKVQSLLKEFKKVHAKTEAKASRKPTISTRSQVKKSNLISTTPKGIIRRQLRSRTVIVKDK